MPLTSETNQGIYRDLANYELSWGNYHENNFNYGSCQFREENDTKEIKGTGRCRFSKLRTVKKSS